MFKCWVSRKIYSEDFAVVLKLGAEEVLTGADEVEEVYCSICDGLGLSNCCNLKMRSSAYFS